MASIFAADAPAGSFNDSTTYDLGFVFRSDANGDVTGIAVYGPSSAPGSVTVSLYSVDSDTTGTLLASKLAGTPLTPGAWNTVSFDTPVAITAGIYYCAQWRTDSWYTFTGSKFSAQAYTVGHLTAIQHDVEPDAPSGGPFNNGRLLVGSGFSSGDGNGAWYGADVVVSFGATVFEQVVAGSVTPTATLNRQAEKALAGTTTPTGAATKALSRTITGSVTPAGATTKVTATSASGSVASAGALVRQVNKAVAGAIAPAAVIVKAISRALTGQITPAGVALKVLSRLLGGGSITASGAVTTGAAAPARDLDLIVGPPQTKWSTSAPEVKWTADAPRT